MLVLGVGRATRLLGQLTLTDKAYDATIRLGQATVTDDAEGEVTESLGVTGCRRCYRAGPDLAAGTDRAGAVVVWAIKVGGVRSYARVRSGEDVTLAARPVTVSRLQVLARRDAVIDGIDVVDLDVVVECSSAPTSEPWPATSARRWARVVT